ncbi:MAG TPA: glycoside hydrolase family 2 protein [Planctomycetota bacterium]|nr:glycoside hydrolase family 2 protein [Planctomycetota bacterium]
MIRLDLAGEWTLSQAGKRDRIRATVPGCVHADLLAAGKIDDPFHRDNELSVQWIGETDWIYSRSFTVPAGLLKCDRVLLRCDGLDTLAVIKFNGKTIARTDNMFRTWEFDVRSALKPGTNRIEIRFSSPIPKSKAPALWAWLELPDADARLSDDFLHIRPGHAVDVLVKPATAMSLFQFQKNLRIRSLIDTYQQKG